MGQHSFRMIETNGITLRVVVEGDGPLLLLLHGFPQCWNLWRNQIDAAGRVMPQTNSGMNGAEVLPEQLAGQGVTAFLIGFS
jgi:pimeloyl-ACP methyl ester carboxylesterase